MQESVQEIRSLSKVLNNDVVLKNGLLASLNVELDRFKRLGYLDASLKITGDIIPINSAFIQKIKKNIVAVGIKN